MQKNVKIPDLLRPSLHKGDLPYTCMQNSIICVHLHLTAGYRLHVVNFPVVLSWDSYTAMQTSGCPMLDSDLIPSLGAYT